MNKNHNLTFIVALITILTTVLVGFLGGFISNIMFLWVLVTEVVFFLISFVVVGVKETFLKSSMATLMVLYAIISIAYTLIVGTISGNPSNSILIGQIIIHALLVMLLLFFKNKSDRLDSK
ncbi:hypothetical protein [Erysipelothrix tonsillarum]|uniref:hypothetical protein n=1 Tax=Erysipelothrix tonsillarum TaxID=38402 RepID=UPI0003681A43|nr:hypothetical protein [Erysipelothrix tonsillarum]